MRGLGVTKFIKVADVSEIPPGSRVTYDFEEESVIVFNVDGKYYAVADLCTHDDGPLDDGPLTGYQVECPRHGARFDIRTGQALCMPAVTGVPTYEVRIKDRSVYVESPDDA